ncbi:hypothetical protein [Samia ricini nucleopolyhedrovirus]|nr:hypothetical protein [Philosamia cynthia ricini nucleopolyhedrovirus virus]BBD51072.1 hypothetical protein [Samia ricini nucleopolyhedrovirus]BBD51221.1 hypothetical protein [Samia ricini nucleopolyhedrovirus]BBD51373.1 hypothetical protein [Samia ricini nucleopolyhedrovirus]
MATEWFCGRDTKKFVGLCKIEPCKKPFEVVTLQEDHKIFVILETASAAARGNRITQLNLFNDCRVLQKTTRQVLGFGSLPKSIQLVRALANELPLLYTCGVQDKTGNEIIKQLLDAVGGVAVMDSMSYFDDSNILYYVNKSLIKK